MFGSRPAESLSATEEPLAPTESAHSDWSAIIGYLEANAPNWSCESTWPLQARAAISAILARTTGEDARDAVVPMLATDAVAEIVACAVDVATRVRTRPVSRSDIARTQLTNALVSGEPSARFARACGARIAESYSVVALSILSTVPTENYDADRCLLCIREKLSELDPVGVLAQLSNVGGTILIPEDSVSDIDADSLLAMLSGPITLPLTGATVSAAPPQIPAAARQAHELLDVALALGRTDRTHRFDDLALEYQLCRPGPGREHLLAVLDPLRPHQELMETLRLYACGERDRRSVARELFVHTNTVDYRLDRVARITGHDPRSRAGLSYLRSALVVDSIGEAWASTPANKI